MLLNFLTARAAALRDAFRIVDVWKDEVHWEGDGSDREPVFFSSYNENNGKAALQLTLR